MNFTAALNRVPESLHLMVRLIVVLQDELGAGNEVTLYAREQLPPVAKTNSSLLKVARV